MSRRTQPQNVSRAFAYQNLPAQNIPNNVNTVLRLDIELFDGLDELDLATNLFTPIRAGYYYIKAEAIWSVVLAVGERRIDIMRNGVVLAEDIHVNLAGAQVLYTKASAITYATPNDVLYAYVYQSSGAGEALSVLGAMPCFAHLIVHRLS